MKLEIKYNKTVLREFQGKLKMREKALPTLKNKEAALRAMVFETRKRLEEAAGALAVQLKQMESWKALWNEFDFFTACVRLIRSGLAGQKLPVLIPQYNGLETQMQVFRSHFIPTGLVKDFRHWKNFCRTPPGSRYWKKGCFCSNRQGRKPRRKSTCMKRCRSLR